MNRIFPVGPDNPGTMELMESIAIKAYEFVMHNVNPNKPLTKFLIRGHHSGWAAIYAMKMLRFVVDYLDDPTNENNIFPVGHSVASMNLANNISKTLMDFVCREQKPRSKMLGKFIINGCHDMRAGLEAVHILWLCQEHLDKIRINNEL